MNNTTEQWAVKIHSASPFIELVQKREQDSLLGFCYREIKCDMIEIPNARNLKRPYIMIIDEEGLLKDKPHFNLLASYYYGIADHGEGIVGDALIMKQKGEIIVWMNREEAEQIMDDLAGSILEAIEAATKKAR